MVATATRRSKSRRATIDEKFSTGLRLTLAGAAATALLGGVVAPAHAATTTVVEKSGSTLLITGAFSAPNYINVGSGRDSSESMTSVSSRPAPAAFQDGPRVAKCSTAGINQIWVSTGARDDSVFTNTGFFTTVLGGDDNDNLRNLGSGQARLNGNDGNDRLFGRTVDSLFGQNGDDRLEGGLFLRGGAGNDTLLGLDGNDSMFGDEGFDNLDGGAGFDELCATAEITANCEAFS